MAELLPAAERATIERAAELLRAGEIVAVPTETVYGLVVLPTDAGVQRLIAAKRRSAEKGIQLLIDSIEQARALADLSPAAERLAARWWPGPLTLVLSRRADVYLPALLGGGRPTLGLRLPDHPVPRSLARLLGPIAATSANLSGEPDATTARHVAETLANEVALIVDDGPVRGGVPSTVVDCSDAAAPPAVLREGAISAAEIAATLAE